jgi:hypothetical protein
VGQHTEQQDRGRGEGVGRGGEGKDEQKMNGRRSSWSMKRKWKGRIGEDEGENEGKKN